MHQYHTEGFQDLHQPKPAIEIDLLSLEHGAGIIARSKILLGVRASAACLMQELVVLQMCLKPLVEESPQVIQLDIACNCVDDQSVPCAQLDLRLCCRSFLQQINKGAQALS